MADMSAVPAAIIKDLRAPTVNRPDDRRVTFDFGQAAREVLSSSTGGTSKAISPRESALDRYFADTYAWQVSLGPCPDELNHVALTDSAWPVSPLLVGPS